jgi:signal transduction histidine kinase
MNDVRRDQGPSDREARGDALSYVESIHDTVREPLLLLDARLRVQSANRAFYRTFRVAPPDTAGRRLYDLGNGQWDIPRLRTLLEEILPQNLSIDDFEVEHVFPDIGPKVMLLNARRLRLAGTELILLAIEDVTERRRGEAGLCEKDITDRKVAEAAMHAASREAEKRQRYVEAILQALPVGVIVTDAEGGVVLTNKRDEDIWGPRPVTRSVEDYEQYRAWWADSGRAVLPDEWASARAVREGAAVLGQVLEIERFDGGHRYVHNSAVPIRDEQGKVTGCAVAIQDITGLRQAEEALQEANRRKDVFLATLAHELRNPLAPLRTGLDLLRVLCGDAAACEEPLRIMDRQLRHLVHLVDDLLDVSRISRGMITLRKERLDLAEIVDAALDMSESGLRRGERRLALDVPPEPLPVEGDRVRLVQVVSNLLNNAAKFTEAGGRITLRVLRRGDRAEIRLQDDGRGIPRDRLAEIFEMFSQSEPGRDAGLGIGLSIARSLVALHGGTIRAESDGPGLGAVFTVSLPLCNSLPAEPEPQEATDTDAIAKRRVLVVDDNRDIVESLRLLFTLLKAEVRVAYDGAEALRVCADWQPTHILMDLRMPGMDGYEAARRLRADYPDRAFRLIAMTGWGRDEDRQRAREAGFDQYLVKPVGVAELKNILAS